MQVNEQVKYKNLPFVTGASSIEVSISLSIIITLETGYEKPILNVGNLFKWKKFSTKVHFTCTYTAMK